MSKRVKIEITEDDIKLGQRMEAELCPIARAVRRVTGCEYVSVDGGEIGFEATSDSETAEIPMPEKVY